MTKNPAQPICDLAVNVMQICGKNTNVYLQIVRSLHQ